MIPARVAPRRDVRDAVPIRVLVVDDHQTFAEALILAMEAERDLECLPSARTVAEALAIVVSAQPDVVVMDVNLPGVNGIEGTRRIRAVRPDTRVVILTGYTDAETITAAIDAGAGVFLPKEGAFRDVIAAVRARAGGPTTADQRDGLLAITGRHAMHGPRRRAHTVRLTPREHEVVTMMSQGLPLHVIARRLNISVHTCRGHVKSTLGKLGAHSQLSAVLTAMKLGILDTDERVAPPI